MAGVSRWLALIGLAAAIFLVAPEVRAQGKKGGGSGGGMHVQEQKSGKVVLEDGSAPPGQVVIQAICGGAPVPVAVTDSKGGFIVGAGLVSDVDASQANVSGGAGGRSSGSSMVHSGCTLRAHFAGYQSSDLRVTDDAAIDLGTIVLSRPAGVTGNLFSATSKEAPKAAQKAFEKARSAFEKRKWDDARPQLEKAVELYPDYAEAWFELGRVYQMSKDDAKAREAFERAVKADPKFTKPYVQLAGILYNQHQWKASVEASSALFKLDPYSYPGTYMLNALCNLQLGNGDAAEASARQAVKLDINHTYPEAEYVLAAVLDERGKSAEVAEHLRAYLQLAPNSPSAENAKHRLAEIEQAQGAKPAGAGSH